MRIHALLVLLALLGGCFGDSDADDAAPATALDEAPAPAEPAPSGAEAPAGNNASAAPEAPAGNATSPAEAAPRTVTVEDDASIGAGVGHPCDATLSACFSGALVKRAVLDVPEAKPAKATLVVTWTPKTPLTSSLRVFFAGPDGSPIAQAAGASPLTLDVPAEAVEAGEHYAIVGPDMPGAAVDQAAHVVLTLAYA